MNKIARITKVISLKTILLHFSSDLAEIFRMCRKRNFALIFVLSFWLAARKNLGAKSEKCVRKCRKIAAKLFLRYQFKITTKISAKCHTPWKFQPNRMKNVGRVWLMTSLLRFSRTEIFAILFIFGSFSDLKSTIKQLLSYKLASWCTFSLVIMWKLSHWKILIFAQVMGKIRLNLAHASIYGHTFSGHNSAIFGPISKRKISW